MLCLLKKCEIAGKLCLCNAVFLILLTCRLNPGGTYHPFQTGLHDLFSAFIRILGRKLIAAGIIKLLFEFFCLAKIICRFFCAFFSLFCASVCMLLGKFTDTAIAVICQAAITCFLCLHVLCILKIILRSLLKGGVRFLKTNGLLHIT